MAQRASDQSLQLAPGLRVRVCDETLQAFYGVYGTVVRVATCRHDGHIKHVDVQMDDLPVAEGYASFYPHELSPLIPGGS